MWGSKTERQGDPKFPAWTRMRAGKSLSAGSRQTACACCSPGFRIQSRTFPTHSATGPGEPAGSQQRLGRSRTGNRTRPRTSQLHSVAVWRPRCVPKTEAGIKMRSRCPQPPPAASRTAVDNFMHHHRMVPSSRQVRGIPGSKIAGRPRLLIAQSSAHTRDALSLPGSSAPPAKDAQPHCTLPSSEEHLLPSSICLRWLAERGATLCFGKVGRVRAPRTVFEKRVCAHRTFDVRHPPWRAGSPWAHSLPRQRAPPHHAAALIPRHLFH